MEKINVGGIAIREGVSRNMIRYEANELHKFSKTLKDRPILKDHNAITDNTIGLVTNSKSIGHGTEIAYSGWIKEDGSGITDKIKDRRIKEVSIGAIAGKLVKENEDDEILIARDIIALELSTTPTPGVVGTSISQSLRQLKKAKTKEERLKVKPILEIVDELEKENQESCSLNPFETQKENYKLNQEKEQMEQDKLEITKEKLEIEQLRKELAEYKVKESDEKLEMKIAEIIAKKLKEQEDVEPEVETEEPKEEPKEEPEAKEPKEEAPKEPEDETKGKVKSEETEDEESSEGLKIEKSKRGFAIFNESYGSKYKRLTR
jgi:hypothetical protein